MTSIANSRVRVMEVQMYLKLKSEEFKTRVCVCIVPKLIKIKVINGLLLNNIQRSEQHKISRASLFKTEKIIKNITYSIID